MPDLVIEIVQLKYNTNLKIFTTKTSVKYQTLLLSSAVSTLYWIKVKICLKFSRFIAATSKKFLIQRLNWQCNSMYLWNLYSLSVLYDFHTYVNFYHSSTSTGFARSNKFYVFISLHLLWYKIMLIMYIYSLFSVQLWSITFENIFEFNVK